MINYTFFTSHDKLKASAASIVWAPKRTLGCLLLWVDLDQYSVHLHHSYLGTIVSSNGLNVQIFELHETNNRIAKGTFQTITNRTNQVCHPKAQRQVST